MNRMISAGALALTAAGLLASAVPAAQAAGPNTCIYNPSSKNVNVKLNSGSFMEVTREFNKIVTFDKFGRTVCVSTTGTVATVNNTAAIFVNGSISVPKQDFIVDFSGGDFLPGAPSSTGDQGRAEVVVFADTTDIVDVNASDNPDFITVSGGDDTNAFGGLLFNGNVNSSDQSVKLPFGNPSLLRINGQAGDDMITGNGIFRPATSIRMQVTGANGNDFLTGGLATGDVLLGEGGNDTLNIKDARSGDTADGGADLDNATKDIGDSTIAVETVNGTVGKPKLTASALKNRQSTVAVSWTHPQAWKNLAKVELGAFVGTERVGTVTMTPATGKIAAHGAISLTRDATLAHKGKTVSAKLALKVAKSVDTDQLHLELSATDKQGKVQTDFFPGL
jgi:hypothetical protein